MGVLERVKSAVGSEIPVEDDLDMENSQRVRNMPDPENPQDAETANSAQSRVDNHAGDPDAHQNLNPDTVDADSQLDPPSVATRSNIPDGQTGLYHIEDENTVIYRVS
jgi:hypothetical protein